MVSGVTQLDIEAINVVPYQVLARIYDSVMSHVDYSAWAQFAYSILLDYGLPSVSDETQPHILECACGTGKIAAIIALCGCRIDACDKSQDMIRIAQTRVTELENPPQYSVMEFLELDTRNSYDAVICLYDSVNYLMDLNDLTEFFIKVKAALKPSGLFLFDICTEFNSKRYFDAYKSGEEGDGFSYIRESQYYCDLKIQENIFTIRLEDNQRKEFIETHRQRIYSVNTIKSVLSRTGFDLLEETDNLSRIPPSETSLRVHFLCRINK